MKYIIDVPEEVVSSISTVTTLAELGSVSKDTLTCLISGVQNAIPVVECNNCIHNKRVNKSNVTMCRENHRCSFRIPDGFYCADGERR